MAVAFESDRRSVLSYLEAHAQAVSRVRLKVLGKGYATMPSDREMERRFAEELAIELGTQARVPEHLQTDHDALVAAMQSVAQGAIGPGDVKVAAAVGRLQEIQFHHAIVSTAPQPGFQLLDLHSDEWPRALSEAVSRMAPNLEGSAVVEVVRTSLRDDDRLRH